MKNKGFTLLETVIYIAILSFLMGGGVSAAFYIIDSSEKNKFDVNVQVEGRFLLRKIDWALTGAATIIAPAPGSHGAVLQLSRSGLGAIVIDAPSGRARISIGGGPALEITNDRVSVQAVNFVHVAAVGSGPAGLEASLTINGQVFTITKYLRK